MPLSSRSWARRGAPLALLGVLAAALPGALGAQARRTLDDDDPQAHLLGFYAAAMLMSPAGLAGPGVEIGGELTVLPHLSERERRVGFGGTKLEKTNFCPVLPRLRGSAVRGVTALDLGFVPPLEVCGVRALLASVAFTRRFPVTPAWAVALRGHLLAGSLEAAITCPAEAIADPVDQTCFQGRESEDRVKPLTGGLDAMLVHSGPEHHPRLELYALVGARLERTRFDVNYVRDTAPALPVLVDRERLAASLARVHAAAGGSWALLDRLRVGGELFYAPGALFTVRARASVRLGRIR
jgi:hypothetical protein